MIILSRTLFPVPLRPSTARVSPRLTVRLTPFKTLWDPKDLYTFSTATTGTCPASLVCSFIAIWSIVAIIVYGKKIMMNFTSTTSARITNREDRTTELVAARPTPSAPPRVRIP